VQFTVADEPPGAGTVTDAGAFATDSEATPVPGSIAGPPGPGGAGAEPPLLPGPLLELQLLGPVAPLCPPEESPPLGVPVPPPGSPVLFSPPR